MISVERDLTGLPVHEVPPSLAKRLHQAAVEVVDEGQDQELRAVAEKGKKKGGHLVDAAKAEGAIEVESTELEIE